VQLGWRETQAPGAGPQPTTSVEFRIVDAELAPDLDVVSPDILAAIEEMKS
jgi:hypothetical protein